MSNPNTQSQHFHDVHYWNTMICGIAGAESYQQAMNRLREDNVVMEYTNNDDYIPDGVDISKSYYIRFHTKKIEDRIVLEAVGFCNRPHQVLYSMTA